MDSAQDLKIVYLEHSENGRLCMKNYYRDKVVVESRVTEVRHIVLADLGGRDLDCLLVLGSYFADM